MKIGIVSLRALLLLTFMVLFGIFPVFSETVVLKSGKKIEGKIIERTADYIKIDFYGYPVTYYFDDIDAIEGEQAITTNPEYMNFCNKGTTFFKQGLYDEALGQWNEAVKISPDMPEAYNNIAVVYACRKDYTKAIENFKKALEKENSDYSKIINWNLANVYCLAGSLKEAADLSTKLNDFTLVGILNLAIQLKEKGTNVSYTIAASSFPPDTVAFASYPQMLDKANLAKVKQAQDREMQLTDDKVYVIENFPLLFLYHSPMSYVNLAQSAIAKKQLNAAKRYLDAALKNVSDMHEYLNSIAMVGIYFYRGRVNLEERNYAESQSNFQRAAELFPKWQILHTYLGISYYLQAKYVQAKDEFKIALRYLPVDSPQAKEINGYLQDIEKTQAQLRAK